MGDWDVDRHVSNTASAKSARGIEYRHDVSQVIGFIELAAEVAATTFVARRLAWALASEPQDWLARAVLTMFISVALIVGLTTTLGALHILNETCVLMGHAVTVIATLVWTKPKATGSSEILRLPKEWLGTLVLLAIFTGISVGLLFHGPSLEFDTIHYHFVHAATWLQTQTTWTIPFLDRTELVATYPGNAQLLSVWLMLPFHTAVFADVPNVVFGVFCVLSCGWLTQEIGGEGWRGSFIGLAVITTSLVMLNEVNSMASDLCAASGVIVALAAGFRGRASGSIRWVVVSGAGLGLAAGSKYVTLYSVVPIFVVITGLLWERERLRRAAVLAVTAVLLGGFWYLRNWVSVGSPIYPQGLTVAGLHIWSSGTNHYVADTPSLFHYIAAGRFDVLSTWLSLAVTVIGPILLVTALGCLAAMSRRFGGYTALLGVLFFVLLAVYMITPLTGVSNDTPQTAGALRYLLPALFIGAAVTASLLPRRYVLPIAAFVIVANVVGDFTQPSYRPDLFVTGVTLLVTLVVTGFVALLMWAWPHLALRRTLVISAPLVLAVALIETFPARASLVPVSAVHTVAPSWNGQVVAINVDNRAALLGTSMEITFKTAPDVSTSDQLSAFLDQVAPTVVALGDSSLPGLLPTNDLVKPSWHKLAESNGTSIYLVPRP